MQNIELNNFKNIIALPIGISDHNAIERFGVLSDDIGHSGSQIGPEINDSYLIPVCTIDSLDEFDVPDHLKIDIDGLELDVIYGMANILMSGAMDSCLIEINDNKERILKLFEGFGYTTDNRFNKLANHSRVRRKKEGINAENVIFTRK